MFLAKHSLQRKLGQPSGTFIMCTCHQKTQSLKWTGVPLALSCKGHSKPIVLQICELGRNSHQTEANAHIVAVGIEFLNTLFIEFWNGKWIWSVLKNNLSHGLFGITSLVTIEGCRHTTHVWFGSQFHQPLLVSYCAARLIFVQLGGIICIKERSTSVEAGELLVWYRN